VRSTGRAGTEKSTDDNSLIHKEFQYYPRPARDSQALHWIGKGYIFKALYTTAAVVVLDFLPRFLLYVVDF
jgi:hypothetical protein